MRERTMYFITVFFVVSYLSAFTALYVLTEGQGEAFMMGLYALSTLVMTTTLILAILFIRPSSKEKYERMLEEKKKE